MRYSVNISASGVPTPSALKIGKLGENNVVYIDFDVTEWHNTLGDGQVTGFFKRRGESEAYPLILSTTGNIATLTVTNVETLKTGLNQMEIDYVDPDGNYLAKTNTIVVDVAKSLTDSTDAPDPYESWLDKLAQLAAQTLKNAQRCGEYVQQAQDMYDNVIAFVNQSKREITEEKQSQIAAVADEGARQIAGVQDAASDAIDNINQLGNEKIQLATDQAQIAVNKAAEAGGYSSDAGVSAENATAQAELAQQNAVLAIEALNRVIAIAQGIQKAIVFSTKNEFLNWYRTGSTVIVNGQAYTKNDLHVGDDIYIKEKDVSDLWFSGVNETDETKWWYGLPFAFLETDVTKILEYTAQCLTAQANANASASAASTSANNASESESNALNYKNEAVAARDEIVGTYGSITSVLSAPITEAEYQELTKEDKFYFVIVEE